MCEDPPPPRKPPKLPQIRMFRRWSSEPYLMLPDEYTDPVPPTHGDDHRS